MSETPLTNKLSFKNLPFDLGVLSTVPESPFPNFLPFTLEFNEELGIAVQEVSREISYWLKEAYTIGSSLSVPLDEGAFGTRRAKRVIDTIKEVLGVEGVKGKSFLEVGCGNGFLLHLLKEEGAARCLGIEPSPAAQEGADKYGVEIIQEFFDIEKINEKFDVVFTHGVLEHIENPLDFLEGLKSCVKKGGILLNAVPDCEYSFLIGDFTMLYHEHCNYFTTKSLYNLYRRLGIEPVHHKNIKEGSKDGNLYMWGIVNGNNGEDNCFSDEIVLQELKVFNDYVSKCNRAINKIQEIINSYQEKGKSIAVYGARPNFLIFHWKNWPRIFDGDFAKHGKFLPGCPNPIEQPVSLKEKPANLICILPINYDSEIRDFLINEIKVPQTSILSFKDIFETGL